MQKMQEETNSPAAHIGSSFCKYTVRLTWLFFGYCSAVVFNEVLEQNTQTQCTSGTPFFLSRVICVLHTLMLSISSSLSLTGDMPVLFFFARSSFSSVLEDYPTKNRFYIRKQFPITYELYASCFTPEHNVCLHGNLFTDWQILSHYLREKELTRLPNKKS